MATWKADLYFEDRINNRKNNIKFTFPALYTYNKLYNNLKKLFKVIGWNEVKYDRNNIRLMSDDQVIINNWNNYILDRDKIQIILFDPTVYHYSLRTLNDVNLLTTSNIETLYDDIKIDLINETLLVYMVNDLGIKIKLIDVLDNPNIYHTQVTNRLIHNYYERYNIII